MLSRERLEEIVSSGHEASMAGTDEVSEMARELLASRWRPITDPPKDGEYVLIWTGSYPHLGYYRPESQDYLFDCDTYGLRKEEAKAWMPVHPPAGTDKEE